MSIDPILYPNTFAFSDTETPNMKTLTIEPLFHGYGTTVGNALRRVLLSSLPGAAVTAMKIANVSHEFSTIDGIQEDVVEISLNVKQVRLKVHSEYPVRLTLSKKGKGAVKAGDFDANADVEIANPDQVIATITDDSTTFEMEVIAEQGRGYVPTEEREKEEQEIGLIKLDAMFSPVRTVSLNVEPVRVGEITNYDKVVMDIETDGTLTPEEAVSASSKILIDHFELLKNAMGGEAPAAPEQE